MDAAAVPRVGAVLRVRWARVRGGRAAAVPVLLAVQVRGRGGGEAVSKRREAVVHAAFALACLPWVALRWAERAFARVMRGW